MASQALASFLVPAIVGVVGAALAKVEWLSRLMRRPGASARAQGSHRLRLAMTLLALGLGAAAGVAVAMLGRPAGLSELQVLAGAFGAAVVLAVIIRLLSRRRG